MVKRQFINPVKPINAPSDIKPAIIIAIDAPLKGAGTSAASKPLSHCRK